MRHYRVVEADGRAAAHVAGYCSTQKLKFRGLLQARSVIGSSWPLRLGLVDELSADTSCRPARAPSQKQGGKRTIRKRSCSRRGRPMIGDDSGLIARCRISRMDDSALSEQAERREALMNLSADRSVIDLGVASPIPGSQATLAAAAQRAAASPSLLASASADLRRRDRGMTQASMGGR